jgi:hypothetical protein
MIYRPSLGCPPCHVNFGGGGCTPCEESQVELKECQGCFDEPVEEGFFKRNDIWPAVISGVIIAVATGITIKFLSKSGIDAT